jgi:hypothetical protein
VSKPGFADFAESVDVLGGGTLPVSVTLTAETRVARLHVASDPDATVTVDRDTAARGGFDGVLASGAHALLVTGPGKVPYRAEIQLKDGETRTMNITLETQKTRGGSPWPWVAAGTAVVAGAVVGSYFLFKSSPGEGPQQPLPDQLGSLQLMSKR